jgi:hypothetical protein
MLSVVSKQIWHMHKSIHRVVHRRLDSSAIRNNEPSETQIFGILYLYRCLPVAPSAVTNSVTLIPVSVLQEVEVQLIGNEYLVGKTPSEATERSDSPSTPTNPRVSPT